MEKGGNFQPLGGLVQTVAAIPTASGSVLLNLHRLMGMDHPSAPVVKVSPRATVEFQVATPSKVETAKEKAVEAGMANLTLDEVRNLYPQWKIERFTSGMVVLRERIDSQGKMFLGINNGYVALFYGQPGKPEGIERVTGVQVNKLRPEDQARLQRGIPVKNLEEAFGYMEGLAN